MGDVFIQLQSTSKDGKTGFPEDISYWASLWEHYINEMEEVVIHCWNEEKEAILELNTRAAFIKEESLVTIFTLNLTEDNRTFLKEHSADSNGGLKWFSMFFQKDGEQRLVIGHYGSENVLYQVDKEKAERFISIFPSVVSSQFNEDD